MAQIFYSLTTCPICGNTLYEIDEILSFPPFVLNTKDPLYIFNDCGCHKKCVLDHPYGNKAINLSNMFILETRPENRLCKVSGMPINNPDNYFFTGLLTSDEKDPLSEHNFVTLDKQNIRLWDKREALVNKLIIYKGNNKWKDMFGTRYLDRMIDDLRAVQLP